MRKYVQGDDVRRIVWRAFQRTGQLLVLEAEQGISDKVVVLLDQDASQHSKGLMSESFETGRLKSGSHVHVFDLLKFLS